MEIHSTHFIQIVPIVNIENSNFRQNVITFSNKRISKCIDVEMWNEIDRFRQINFQRDRKWGPGGGGGGGKIQMLHGTKSMIFGRSQIVWYFGNSFRNTNIAKEKGQNSLTCWHIVVLVKHRCTCTSVPMHYCIAICSLYFMCKRVCVCVHSAA